MEKLHYALAVKLYGQEKAFGPGLAELLTQVRRQGSLQKGAQAMGMAYSKAWNLIKNAEKEWEFPLTLRSAGGKDGGGSSLTWQAETLLDCYQAMLAEVDKTVQEQFAKYFSAEKLAALKEGKAHS